MDRLELFGLFGLGRVIGLASAARLNAVLRAASETAPCQTDRAFCKTGRADYKANRAFCETTGERGSNRRPLRSRRRSENESWPFARASQPRQA